ncbi:hypothetical protein ES319_A05G361500v1 [Gossypium barbadense]|uniref:RRM domain-containing protein n=1 Tax=Gossypium barbadense TaxID=3634 RepID=A0A5J5VXB7_GOSBA|nr:hypothetical protein ES319_A05G361500v1 [Gossypium barbadense]
MPRYDDRRGSGTRLYVGHLSSRTRSRDLEDMFSRYGRIRDVDMKRDYAFVEFSDPRDADDARYSLNGRDLDGSRIVVEFAKGVLRGFGGSRDYPGRSPAPGAGRCFNCHIERNCQNSPKKLSHRPRSYSRSPSPCRGRSRSRSYSRGRSNSRSRTPVKRERGFERDDRRSRSPKSHRSSPLPPRGRKHSPTLDERSPQEGGSPSPRDRRHTNGSEYSPRERSQSPDHEADAEDRAYRSSTKENGQSCSPSPVSREDRSPIYNDDDNSNRASRRSESN